MHLPAGDAGRCRHQPTRLDGGRRLSRVVKALAHDEGSCAQSCVRIAHPHLDERDVVGVARGEKTRRARGEGGVSRGDGGKRLVLDDDALEGILGDVTALRHHESHWLAGIARHAARDGRLQKRGGTVGRGHAVGNDGCLGNIRGREDGEHAGHGEGGARVHPHDARVRVGGAQHRCLRHAGQAHVAHEAAAPREETFRAKPGQGLADHARLSRSCSRRTTTPASSVPSGSSQCRQTCRLMAPIPTRTAAAMRAPPT